MSTKKEGSVLEKAGKKEEEKRGRKEGRGGEEIRFPPGTSV